jgi:hypothetical protein
VIKGGLALTLPRGRGKGEGLLGGRQEGGGLVEGGHRDGLGGREVVEG